MHPAPFRVDIPTDAPVPAMLTRALNVFVEKFGEQMICASEERNMDGRLTIETSYEVIDGPCAGKRFKIAFSLEPNETVTH
jgi:hypothetical protein